MRNCCIYFLVSLISSLLLGGCISIRLPMGTITKLKEIEITAPPKPFQPIKTQSSDQTWLSEKTGNTISYLTECDSSHMDFSLENLESDSLSIIGNSKILNSSQINFKGFEARQSIAVGNVEGTPIQLALVIFKRNQCTIILSYGGIQKSFEAEFHHFENFKENFRIP